MALTLQAVAKLNINPYMRGLKLLQSGTSALNKTQIAGEESLGSATRQRSKENQKAFQNDKANTEQLTKANTSLNRSIVATGESLRSARDYVDGYANKIKDLNRLQLAQAQAADRVADSTRRLALAETAYGRDSSQYRTAQSGAERAVAQQKRATEALDAHNTKLRESEVLEGRRANALSSSNQKASEFVETANKMNDVDSKRELLTNRLASAQARLGVAYAASGGVTTRSVLAAEGAALSASNALKRFNESQMLIEKHGPGAASGLAAQRNLYNQISRNAFGASVLLAAFPALALGVGAAWEKSFSSVVRTADPTFTNVQSRVDALRDSLVGMAQSMPTSFSSVTEIATLANQMGIASGQVAEFTRTVSMFSATSGVSVDMAATAFGRMTSILGDSRIPFIEMADAILKVGVNSVATEEEIINVNTQISSIAAQAGFSAKEMIALSGALASVRVPPELSRGLVTRLFGQFDKAISDGGSALESFARISGKTSEEVRKTWGGEGSAQLFNSFLQGIQKLGPAARKELENLGITSVRDLPVILRLSNAADSEGVVGELFSQTLRDAQNSAGETQRQYTIMADTVVGKLKILGNNLMAFFDAVGQSSLGGFGDLLSNMSDGIRDFTNSLDKPAKLFGSMELPFTNAEFLGLVTKVLLFGSALMLAVSVMTKLKSAAVATMHALNLMAGGNLAQRWGTMFASISQGSGVMNGLAVNASKSALAAGGARAAFSGLSSLLGGPLVWGTMLAVGAIWAISEGMKYTTTDADAFAESLAKIDTSRLVQLNSVLDDIWVKRNWGQEVNPFDRVSLQDQLDQLEAERNRLRREIENTPLSTAGTLSISATYQQEYQLKPLGLDPDTAEGIGVIDDAFQKLVDGGNLKSAVGLLQNLGNSGADFQEIFNTDKAGNLEKFLKNAFSLANVKWTNVNLDKFARGQLPEVIDALYGFEGAGKAAQEVFDGDVEGLGAFSSAVDEALSSFINFNSAVESATVLDGDGIFQSFDLSAFTKTLQDQVKDQEQWASDIQYLSKTASSGVIEALSELGPEGKNAVRALAQGIQDGTPEAIEAMKQLEASVTAQAFTLGNEIAVALSNREWAKSLLGADLGAALAATLSSEDMSALYDAAQGVGDEAAKEILDALVRGEMTYDEALRALALEVPVKAVFDWSEAYDADVESAINREFTALTQKLKIDSKISLSAEIDSATTVSEFKKLIDDPELKKIDIEGNLSLREAYATSREFQIWAEENGVDIYLGANDMSARLTANALILWAEDQNVQMQLDAIGYPAEGKIWDIVQLADGTTAFIPMDADGTPAEEELAYIVDKAGNTVGEVKINANDANASAVISRYNGKVVASSYIQLYELPPGRARANGGIDFPGRHVESYARGGIRSKHVAQIAPAGAMRVWAEPETEGEAYIPFARSKRTRSVNILDQVAQRFGYQLAPLGQQLAQFANGGMYELQSRSRYGRMSNDIVDSNQMQRIINFVFNNPVERDWGEDALEKARTIGLSL